MTWSSNFKCKTELSRNLRDVFSDSNGHDSVAVIAVVSVPDEADPHLVVVLLDNSVNYVFDL